MSAAGTKVALVTGSNKGIGFAIVRGLCKEFKGDVFLLSRNEERGQQAVAELAKEGLSPKFHQLDICDQNSIDRLHDFVKNTYGGIDVLVNNAGIAYKVDSTAPFGEQAEVTMETNYWGTLKVCNSLFPLLRDGARVVNVSSMAGKMALEKCSPDLQKKFRDPELDFEILGNLMTDFVKSAKAGIHQDKGWPNTAYGTTKIGVTAMTFIQQREINLEPLKDVLINCCCPGYVATDMSSHKGPLTIDQGAETPLYLALLPPGAPGPKGSYVKDKTVQEW